MRKFESDLGLVSAIGFLEALASPAEVQDDPMPPVEVPARGLAEFYRIVGR